MNPTTIKSNTKEYRNLKIAADILEYESPSNSMYYVEDTYFDYGQDWVWTTIVRLDGRWGGVQAVTPAEWEKLIFADSIEEIVKIVHEIRSNKFFSDK